MERVSKYLGLAFMAGAIACACAAAQEMRLQPPPMERVLQGKMLLHGRWWDDSKVSQQLNLTADQQKKMDDIFQQNRLKLIDLQASLQKQEVIMQPLMEADQPDEGKILAQIDAIAQARAELEKNNARMLLGLRQVLTPDQWKKLKDLPSDRHIFVQRFHREPDGDGPVALPDGGPGPNMMFKSAPGPTE